MLDAPDADACRLLALSDGTVINQSPVAKQLCTMNALLSSKRKIARDFYDGRGEWEEDESHHSDAFVATF